VTADESDIFRQTIRSIICKDLCVQTTVYGPNQPIPAWVDLVMM